MTEFVEWVSRQSITGTATTLEATVWRDEENLSWLKIVVSVEMDAEEILASGDALLRAAHEATPIRERVGVYAQVTDEFGEPELDADGQPVPPVPVLDDEGMQVMTDGEVIPFDDLTQEQKLQLLKRAVIGQISGLTGTWLNFFPDLGE